jgi:hypothetical protein
MPDADQKLTQLEDANDTVASLWYGLGPTLRAKLGAGDPAALADPKAIAYDRAIDTLVATANELRFHSGPGS